MPNDKRLEDAYLVSVDGITHLKNRVTGERLYSYCGSHRSHQPECDPCHQGMWALDTSGEVG